MDGNLKKWSIFEFHFTGMFILFLRQNLTRNSNLLFSMQIEAQNYFSMGLLRENKGKWAPDFGFWDVKKKVTRNCDELFEKTQHRGLDMITRHLSMFLFFPFFKNCGSDFFFWRIFEFLQDFHPSVHFHPWIGLKWLPRVVLMLFWQLTYLTSWKSRF